ncbi:hypothetical protein [Bradyrhizobium sp. NAS96.2]|uniref:hypothetical protein n=1 Tax=Bradyrhizobium sp. NAS96.2 TaxID=1680160 RepID=UPI00116116AB|nr:hypothetical protein [Bradyrhizobium sp. NAS96.2]
MAMLGRIVAQFAAGGLTPRTVQSSKMSEFLGKEENSEIAADVLRWMVEEGLIRADVIHKDVMQGDFAVYGAQLTSKGVAVLKSKTETGDTIERQIRRIVSETASMRYLSWDCGLLQRAL